ncbi:MAG: DUF1571 domain-containing protein [Bacteroidales bacterium]|nr:DUF1571 domain-containing protein [Bacteroidales bacterium]
MKQFFIIMPLLCYCFTFSQTCQDVINQSLQKISELQTASFYIIAKERFGNDFKLEKAFYKVQNNPLAIYYKQLFPPTHAEVLINEKYQKMALVNPNGFPYISLKLSPFGEKLREKQHHNIFQAGFTYIKSVLIYLKNKYNVSWTDVCQLFETVKIKNTECYKITLINKFYKITDYTLPKDISLQTLALQLFLCDYKILELNPEIKNIFSILPKGTKIKIPSDYAQKIVMFIDKSTLLPIKIEVYDEIGLFEEYMFEDITINPKFSPLDFDENNKDYGFK